MECQTNSSRPGFFIPSLHAAFSLSPKSCSERTAPRNSVWSSLWLGKILCSMNGLLINVSENTSSFAAVKERLYAENSNVSNSSRVLSFQLPWCFDCHSTLQDDLCHPLRLLELPQCATKLHTAHQEVRTKHKFQKRSLGERSLAPTKQWKHFQMYSHHSLELLLKSNSAENCLQDHIGPPVDYLKQVMLITLRLMWLGRC